MFASPYKGLIPYSEEDAAYFFGRARERELITANALASRFTLLYGPSGVGKSSVLGAGVIAHLRAKARENVARTGIPKLLPVLVRNWRDDPVSEVAAQIHRGVKDFLPDGSGRNGNGSCSLAQVLNEWAAAECGDVVVVLDQFEEYFLYHPNEDGPGTLAYELPEALSKLQWLVSVLLSIREDAIAKLDRFEGRIPGLFENYLRVDHLDSSAARTAICGPLDEFNRRNGTAVGIESKLIDAVLDGVRAGTVQLADSGRGSTGDNSDSDDDLRIETPYLQLVMTRLWEEEVARPDAKLSLEALSRLGGVENIVRTHLDVRMESLAPEDRDITARVFHHLVTPSGTKIAHTAADLAGYAQLETEPVRRVLEALCEARILEPVNSRYEIYHDVLAPAILAWRTRHELDQQMHAAAEEAAEQARATEAEAARARELEQAKQLADERQARMEHEARSARRLRYAIAGITLAAIAFAIVAVLFFREREQIAGYALSLEKREAEARSSAKAAEQARKDSEKASNDAIQARESTVQALKRAEQAQLKAEGEAAVAQSRQLASTAVADISADPQRALATAIEAVTRARTREAEEALHAAVQNARLRYSLPGHVNGVSALDLSADGKLLLSADGNRIRLWDVTSGGLTVTYQDSSAIRDAALDPVRRWIAVGNERTLKLVRLPDLGEIRNVSDVPGGITALTVSSDGRFLAWSAAKGPAMVADLRSERPTSIKAPAGSTLTALRFAPAGHLLASGYEDGHVDVWDASKNVLMQSLPRPSSTNSPAVRGGARRPWHLGDDFRLMPVDFVIKGLERVSTSRVTSVSISADGRFLAAARQLGLRVWEIATGEEVQLTASRYAPRYSGFVTPAELYYSGPKAEVQDTHFSPSGELLAEAWSNGLVRVRDVALRQYRYLIEAHKSSASRVLFTPDGRQLITSSPDGEVRVWNTMPRQEWLSFPTGNRRINQADYTPDGKYIVTASRPPRMWDAATGKLIRTFGERQGVVIALSPDGRRLASADLQRADVWELESGRRVATVDGKDRDAMAVAWSPDGRTAAIAGAEPEGRGLVLWDTIAGRQLQTVPGQFATSLAFSPDGRTLAAVGMGLTLFSVSGNQVKKRFSYKDSSRYFWVSFNPAGAHVVAAAGSSAKVFDTSSGRLLHELKGHDGKVLCAAYSPDGRTIATGGADRSIRLWEAQSARETLTFANQTDEIWSVQFSPDGRRLLSAASDGTVSVLAVNFDDLMKLARDRLAQPRGIR